MKPTSSDSPVTPDSATNNALNLSERYHLIRKTSEQLIEGLSAEDCALQAVPETSPAKWHLAHTTWFFETFILKQHVTDYTPFHPQFEFLFNSYYNDICEQYSRQQRHLLSRPSLQEVMQYRAHVDQAMQEWLNNLQGESEAQSRVFSGLVELGLNHEQQHQELLLMDLKFNFFQNPLYPSVQIQAVWQAAVDVSPLEFIAFEEGLFSIGADDNQFAFDNERPKHQVYVAPFQLANRLITQGEYLEFIAAGGYDNPKYWLSDGWQWRQSLKQHSPLYWLQQAGDWYEFTLQGVKPLDLNRPVSHVSYYEADAFARYMNSRLATEQEWEVAARWQKLQLNDAGHFADQKQWHPKGLQQQAPLHQLFGELWEWTASAYGAYPGFKVDDGAVGEYNGKFMCNQMVLRGGACVTPADHVRVSYRNFFYPQDRWPFTGIRLARSH